MDDTRMIQVLIVDDHLLVRDGLRLLLSTFDDIVVIGLADGGLAALDACASLRPDVVLMDLMMPDLDGPSAIGRIRGSYPAIQVIALTSFLEEGLVHGALQAGAVGYLLKNISARQLADAIRDAHAGRTTIDPAAVPLLVQALHHPRPLGHDLTERERQVLALLTSGRTNREIARTLQLSSGTIRVYVSNILAKLGAGNRTEAATLALQNHLCV